MGRSEVCVERREGPRRLPLNSTATLSAATAIAALAGPAPAGPLLKSPLPPASNSSSSPSLFVEVQLDAVIEMSLLQHFAQVAGAQMSGQRLFFVIVQVVSLRLVASQMRCGLKLFAFNHLFFDQPSAGSIGRCLGSSRCYCRSGLVFLLFLSAEAKKPKARRGRRIDAVRSRRVRFFFRRTFVSPRSVADSVSPASMPDAAEIAFRLFIRIAHFGVFGEAFLFEFEIRFFDAAAADSCGCRRRKLLFFLNGLVVRRPAFRCSGRIALRFVSSSGFRFNLAAVQ